MGDVFQSSFRYVVFVGPSKLGFSKVSGLKYKMPMEQLKVGGVSAPVMVHAEPKSGEALVFEKGMSAGLKMLPFIVGSPIIMPVTVVALNEQGLIGRAFAVEKPIVEAWELSDMDAMSGEVIIEKFSVCHSGIFEC